LIEIFTHQSGDIIIFSDESKKSLTFDKSLFMDHSDLFQERIDMKKINNQSILGINLN
jgi:hypothetical protein